MKKLLLIAGVFLILTAFKKEEEKKVFICVSVASKRYHLKRTCKGLQACKAKIKTTTAKKAEKLGRTFCKWEKKRLENK